MARLARGLHLRRGSTPRDAPPQGQAARLAAPAVADAADLPARHLARLETGAAPSVEPRSRGTIAAPSQAVKLFIQIPCLNEEATLPRTLAELPREVEGFDR